MAHVKKRPIDGQVSKVHQKRNDAFNSNHEDGGGDVRNDLVLKLICDIEWLEHYINGDLDTRNYTTKESRNNVDFISSRLAGNQVLQRASFSTVYGTKHLLKNNLMNEKTFDLNQYNKVFCSQWLTDRQIVLGTKCNKLIVVDVLSGKKDAIPTLESSSLSTHPDNNCGIHSIAINPSRTLLATGANNPNDLAIYKLPTMDPVSIGESAHDDWIFDIVWLDDEYLMTGSRDSKVALWKVGSAAHSKPSQFSLYNMISPVLVIKVDKAEKIRALLFNKNISELVALSLNAQLHVIDTSTMKQTISVDLPYCHENVCLAQENTKDLYAVGSKSHITLVDARNVKPFLKIVSKFHGQGVRSLSFHDHLLTIGTGNGALLFYDIRAESYLESIGSKNSVATLRTKIGTAYPEDFDNLYQNVEFNMDYRPAIYTHQYDSSGTRLFAAGGPLPASLHGNYCALWQ